MSAIPDYNLDSPATLLVGGALQGKAIGIDTATTRPCEGKPIFVANLTSHLPLLEDRDGEPGVVAVKSVEDDRSRMPQDGKREARILAQLDHPNIVRLLNAYLSPPSPSSPIGRITLFVPFYPLTLRDLLSHPSFTPARSPDAFYTVTYSLTYQLLAAVDYLHREKVAHRDINPNNVLLARSGRIVLVDFGIAVKEGDEPPGTMHFEVGTGSYRAPELAFASRAYFAPALDLWATATTLAELFRPLELPSPPSPSSSEEPNGSHADDWRKVGAVHAHRSGHETRLERKTLFQGAASDFLLAGSIFKVVGTPTIETWPEAAALPNFSRFTFTAFPPTPLASHLPYLRSPSPLAVVLEGMIVCSAAQRMSAADALSELRSEEVVLPPGVEAGGTVMNRQGETLSALLATLLAA
ncbi:hypothetical protein JCM10207_008674 [Rhodosporidiobolus poonsookiae]